MNNYMIQAASAGKVMAGMHAALAKLADKHGFKFDGENCVIEIPPNTDIRAFVWDLKRTIERLSSGETLALATKEAEPPHEATIRHLREENKLLSEDNIKLRQRNAQLRSVVNDIAKAAARMADDIEAAEDRLGD